MMNDTSGLTFETPLTRFDQVTQSWRTSQDTSLWDLPMSSPTLPASGSMRNGELFERPMLERPTSATGSSSLPTLATPDTMESLPVREGEAYEKAKRRGSGLSVREDSGNLREQVVHNLPTPTARDYKDTTVRMEPHRPNDTDTINRALASITTTGTAWGKYEPAIRRWENLTREAPEPTVPHKDKRRLNPVFVEWMMGLPEGHVTGRGLTPAKELKMLGNGVVPQQARAAVNQLMGRMGNVGSQ